MENQFIPYELALKLKELGFECEYHFKEYDTEGYLQNNGLLNSHELEFIIAPLWQQSFDWFREKYNLNSWVYKFYDDEVEKELYRFNLKLGDFYSSFYNTYEKARQACLEKLIEIVENENRTH